MWDPRSPRGAHGGIVDPTGEPVDLFNYNLLKGDKMERKIDYSKVKTPTGNRIGDRVITWGAREHYKNDQSWERFNANHIRGYGGTVSPARKYQGFEGYDLAIHDLLPIHGYDRSGEIHKIIKERIGEPYLMGIELEIERVTDREIVGEILSRYLPDRHICVRDGSIASDGVEIVTSPLAPREIGRIPWYNLLRELSRSGCTSHDSGSCGLHISISRRYLQDRTWRSIRSMLSRDRVLFESLSRRTIGKGGKGGDPFHFCSFSPRESKYQALNLSKGSVCEFRFFRGTLSPASFIASIEIVRSIVEYARDRESRSGDRAPRITGSGWIEWVEHKSGYGVARDYIKDHVERFRSIPRAPRAPRGSGASNRVSRFIVDRIRGCTGATITDQGEIHIGNGNHILGGLPGWNQGEPVEYRIPILWDRSYYLPQYVRDAIDRGRAPREIIVRSTYRAIEGMNPIGNRGIVFSFYRGGWGNTSALYAQLREPIAR
jgi:hypothetical protein